MELASSRLVVYFRAHQFTIGAILGRFIGENSMSNSDLAWKKRGKDDPYYGVLSHSKFSAGSIEDNTDEFFRTGEDYISSRLERFEKHFGELKRDRALDFGSGVGRLTLPIARRFGEVVGIDISPDMIAEAKTNAKKHSISNVSFIESDDNLTRIGDEFNFVQTYIVLQHIPVKRGMNFISRLLDVVAVGGGTNIHLSIDRQDSAVGALRYTAQKHIPGASRFANVMRGRKWDEALMQMNEYSLAAVFKLMHHKGFADILVDFEYHGRILTATLQSRRSV